MLTWSPYGKSFGTPRAIKMNFINVSQLPMKEFRELSYATTIWLSWSTVLGWSAPFRYPSVPLPIRLSDKMCKLVHRISEHLKAERDLEQSQAISEAVNLLRKLKEKMLGRVVYHA